MKHSNNPYNILDCKRCGLHNEGGVATPPTPTGCGGTIPPQRSKTLAIPGKHSDNPYIILDCKRCGHYWPTLRTKDNLPKVCPKCKSPYWLLPRGGAKPRIVDEWQTQRGGAKPRNPKGDTRC